MQQSIDKYAPPEDMLGDVLGEIIAKKIRNSKDVTLEKICSILKSYNTKNNFKQVVSKEFRDINLGGGDADDIGKVAKSLLLLKGVFISKKDGKRIEKYSNEIFTTFKKSVSIGHSIKKHYEKN